MVTRSNSHKVRDQAFYLFSALITDLGWIIRNKQDQNDYGIDCEVEIVNNGLVTGNIFYCQLKGTGELKWKTNTESVNVKSKTWDYWFRMAIPVTVLLVDIKNQKIYWTTPFSFPPSKAKSVNIKFKKDNLLESNCESLNFYISSWKNTSKNKSIITSFPMHHKIFIELYEKAQWDPDPFYYFLEDEEYLKFYVFYEYVFNLNLVLGMNFRIIPFEFWVKRSNFVTKYENENSIIFEVYKEALRYVTFFFDSSFLELLKRHKKTENNLGEYLRSIKKLSKPSKQTMFYSIAEDPDEELSFNDSMEKIMDFVDPQIKVFTCKKFNR